MMNEMNNYIIFGCACLWVAEEFGYDLPQRDSIG